MSKFFTFPPTAGANTFNIYVRLDQVTTVFILIDKKGVSITKTEERERSFWERLTSQWSVKTETVEVEDIIIKKIYKICASRSMKDERNNYYELAATESSELSGKLMADLLAALEAS